MTTKATKDRQIETAQDRFSWALAACQKAQMRMTPVRESVLRFLAERSIPPNIEAVSHALHERFVETTIYRTLMLFVSLELVRLIRLQNRHSYFVLNAPGHQMEYLICRQCGSVVELPNVQAVAELEEQISSTRGYTALYHELGFYGICPNCQSKTPASQPLTKLPARFKSQP